MKHPPTTAQLSFPAALDALAGFFADAGARLYAVGGQVRNPLLGLPVSDRDVCSALPPDAVMALCQAHGLRHTDVGAAYGTVAIHMDGFIFEHTTFRADDYPPGGVHRPQRVTFGTSLTDDAFRRDFTVNALYTPSGGDVPQSPQGGLDDWGVEAPAAVEILDPTGHGLADLRAGVIRATSPDPADILRSDALRILRMVRFAAELGFTVEPDTFAAAKAHVAGLADISAERIREELTKILLADLRYGENNAVYRGLAMLNDLGALDIILPELAACRGVPQRAEYHAYDVLQHMLHTCAAFAAAALPSEQELRQDTPGIVKGADPLDVHSGSGDSLAGTDEIRRISYPASCNGRERKRTVAACELTQGRETLCDLAGRLAALLHDIGKPEARRRNADLPTQARGHMTGHDAIGAALAREDLTRLRFPTAVIDETCALIAHHMFDLTGTAKESTLRERFAQWGYAHSLAFATLREADVRGSGRTPPQEPVETAERFFRVLAQMRAEGAPFSTSELACTGGDVMAWTGLPPGPRVGEILRALLLHCARKPGDNTPAKLQRLCRDMLSHT